MVVSPRDVATTVADDRRVFAGRQPWHVAGVGLRAMTSRRSSSPSYRTHGTAELQAHSRTVAWLTRALSRLWFLEHELGVLPALIHRGAVCLDVGANRGAYMVALSLLAGPSGRVTAIEPHSGPLRTASAMKTLLHLRNVRLVQCGLSDVEGRIELLLPLRWGMPVYGRSFMADAPELSGDDLDEFTGARKVSIPVTTLDAMAGTWGRLDFIKCDIEGAELRMLQGGEGTIERLRPIVLLEIEDRHVAKYGHTAADVLNWLHDRDYVAYVAVLARAGGDRAPVINSPLRPVTVIDDTHRNYIFVPAEQLSGGRTFV